MELPDITNQEQLNEYMESLRTGGVLNEYITKNIAHRGRLSTAQPMNPQIRQHSPHSVKGSGWGPFAFFGRKDPDALFEGGLKTTVPFESAGRSKTRSAYEKDKVTELVRRSPEGLRPVDPRFLTATQSSVTSPGVDYYMGDEYEKTGKTYRDQSQAGNVYPVVYERETPDGYIEPMILSGHHRASAALLKGEALRALVVRGNWGP